MDRVSRLFCVALLLLLAAPLAAQEAPPESDQELRARLARLEADFSALRNRLGDQERESADRELRARSLVNIYGDIGLAYHMLFESKTETFNRPDFRLHLGVFGTAFEQDKQRLRYDLRLTTVAEDLNGKPTPTLSWLPFPGYGVNPQLALDRFSIEFALSQVFSVTAGRFPSPFAGGEALFDHDYHFQGLTQTLRLDHAAGESFRRVVPRLALTSTQGYMAQNNIGLPSPTAESQPIYVGAQFEFHFAPFETSRRGPDGRETTEINSDFEWRLALGIHWFDGEEGIASNLGVGYLSRTTNVLAPDGLVQSEFLVGEVYTEVILLRSRRARVKAWFHGLFNFHAEPQVEGRSERNEMGFEAGLSWGMEQLTQRWDFRVGARYFHLEADVVIPEFNSELLNTNIKGWQVDLLVRVFPSVTAFGNVMLTERENFELAGFGLANKDKPNRASGQSFRVRIGLYLEF
ncbi:MAG: putative porin [Planctomycetes bacterium]|nr:putative porin [Planctomycetota bacterium]